MKKVRFTWNCKVTSLVGEGFDGSSFTMEHEDGKTTCIETGITIDQTDDEFKTFTDTMSEFAGIEILEQ